MPADPWKDAKTFTSMCDSALAEATRLRDQLESATGARTIENTLTPYANMLRVLDALPPELRPSETAIRQGLARALDTDIEQINCAAVTTDGFCQSNQGKNADEMLDVIADRPIRRHMHYCSSKAALSMMVRALALDIAPIRVNGVAPATVVQGSAMFPRDRVIGSLAKYNIPYTDDEATESLVKKLAQFYADRTLTKAPITPADQAEAYFLLVSQRLSKTTGQVITVDGGLHEAFLR